MQNSDKPKCIRHNDCYSVCCYQRCIKNPFMCKQQDCQCYINHQQCITNIRWTLLKEKVLNKINVDLYNINKITVEIDTIFATIHKEILKFHNEVKQILIQMSIGKKIMEFEDNLKNNNYKQMNGSHIFLLSNEIKNQSNILLNPSVPNHDNLVNNFLEQLTKISEFFEQTINVQIEKNQQKNLKASCTKVKQSYPPAQKLQIAQSTPLLDFTGTECRRSNRISARNQTDEYKNKCKKKP